MTTLKENFSKSTKNMGLPLNERTRGQVKMHFCKNHKAVEAVVTEREISINHSTHCLEMQFL